MTPSYAVRDASLAHTLCAPVRRYDSAPSTPWPSAQTTEGYMRRHGNLSYATVLRTGHLVPTVVPKTFATLLGMLIK